MKWHDTQGLASIDTSDEEPQAPEFEQAPPEFDRFGSLIVGAALLVALLASLTAISQYGVTL